MHASTQSSNIATGCIQKTQRLSERSLLSEYSFKYIIHLEENFNQRMHSVLQLHTEHLGCIPIFIAGIENLIPIYSSCHVYYRLVSRILIDF